MTCATDAERERFSARWYLLAVLLPLPISALAGGLESLWGAPGPTERQPISTLGIVVFVLVLGEEIGWRGFALPHLLTRSGPWIASFILGTLWALWHLPLFFIAAIPQFGKPVSALRRLHHRPVHHPDVSGPA
jgi:membrane protease YdiL (CAAX protease family)